MLSFTKALHGLAPLYLSELVCPCSRSSEKCLLTVPELKLEGKGDCVFVVAAPKLWKCLLLLIKSSPSTDTFKTTQWWQCRRQELGLLIWPDSGASFMPSLNRVWHPVVIQLISFGQPSLGQCWARSFLTMAQWWQCWQLDSSQVIWPDSGPSFMEQQDAAQ